jgi:transcriptional regulator with XRE-family HTH domain
MFIFAENLKNLRNKYQLSIETLSIETNISKEKILNWEEGNLFPNQEELQKIANYFSVSITTLQSEKNFFSPSRNINSFNNTFNSNQICPKCNGNSLIQTTVDKTFKPNILLFILFPLILFFINPIFSLFFFSLGLFVMFVAFLFGTYKRKSLIQLSCLNCSYTNKKTIYH